MATAALPVATRAALPAKEPAAQGPAPREHEQTRTRGVGALPGNPWEIPAEHDQGGGTGSHPSGGARGLNSAQQEQDAAEQAWWAQIESANRLPLQCKLAIGAINDPLESEADAMAERVLQTQEAPASASEPPAVRRKLNGEDSAESGRNSQPVLLRKAAGAVTPQEAPPIVHQVLRSSGQALDAPTRSFMESRFGQDFGGVRIHTGPAAEESAQAVHAQAYTLGNHVVFAPGKYNPASSQGKRLLAHELTHTIQQQADPHRNRIQRDPDADKAAAEAARVARLVQEYDAELTKARASGDWKTVAEKLNGFTPEDIETRLALLTPAEVKSMHDGAVANPAVGPNSNAATLTLPGWSDGTKWNRGVQNVRQVRRIPIQGLTEGNQSPDLDKNPNPRERVTSEAADGRAIVLIPEGLDVTKPVEVLLFLHGMNIGYRQRSATAVNPGTVRDVENDRMEEQIKASNRPMIGILPQGTRGSGFGANFNSDAYIADVFRVLKSLGAFGDKPAPQVRSVIFGGHSGAGGTIAEILAQPGQPRLSSKLGEVALFDAINGPDELGKVTRWVREHLDHDLSALTASGVTPAQQMTYLQTSMRFRAYYTNYLYKERHETLNASIEAWFTKNGSALGGNASPVYKALRDNYRVIPVGHGDHDRIVGRGDRLLDAINHLPQGSASAASSGSSSSSSSSSAAPPDTIQRKAENSQSAGAAALPQVEEVLESPGEPLDASLRSFFQPRFQHDLSQVRVHTDPRAAASAHAVNAAAYAVGRDIVFGNGRYDPASPQGMRLLAHELAHVVKQDASPSAPRNTVRRNLMPPPLSPIRADEAGKKLATFTYGRFTIFVPNAVSKAATGDLKVHIFFSAGAVQGDQGNDVLTHGLRGASAQSDWVMIAVPAFRARPTISDQEIVDCLKSISIYKPMTTLRLSGHSRGAFWLMNSVVQKKITALSLIDRVTLLDADDNPDPASPTHETTVPKVEMLKRAGINPAKIVAYEVNVHKRHIAGAKYIGLDSGSMAAIGYVRLILDSMVTKPGLAALVAANPAIKNQLDSLQKPKAKPGAGTTTMTQSLPSRGGFTTGTPGPGQVSLQAFSRDYSTEIQAILSADSGRNGLLRFINDNDLVRFNNGPKPYIFDRGVSAHHFFAAEVAHELTE